MNNIPLVVDVSALLNIVKKLHLFDELTTCFFKLRDLSMSDEVFFQDIKNLFIYEVCLLQGRNKAELEFLEYKVNELARQIKEKHYPNNGSLFEYIHKRLKVFVDKEHIARKSAQGLSA